jgi:hypothetical protein
MVESVLRDKHIASAVSNIKPRSERQPNVEVLQRTYVETGVLPQLNNENNQILYGRRGTGKSHVLRVLGVEVEEAAASAVLYIDIRMLGSAQLMTDDTRPLSVRCVSVFKDLLGLVQGQLLDIATNPARDSSGLEEVSQLADLVLAKSVEVSSRQVTSTESASSNAETSAQFKLSKDPGIDIGDKATHGAKSENRLDFTESLRDTVVFAEVAGVLDHALRALGLRHLYILIDEWTAIPPDVQPYIAEFLKRAFFPSNRITIKIASLEYRSRFTISVEKGNPIGFELGGDLSANLDLDDYYVYDRNPERVVSMFLELLYKHVRTELPDGYLETIGASDAAGFRSRFFTEPATFVELVRAGEGVVRDFLGIFASAYFRAERSGRVRIDLNSVEESARDWYETDKSTVLGDAQRTALNRIMTDVIGNRQAKMFMLAREHAGHPMIQGLFDLRLIHLISRGYSDKENPGLRYNIYSLDYGTYVDLKRTKSEPEDFEETDEESTLHSERVVPFKDKRSIRRIILDPSIFNDLHAPAVASAP